jgi:hypothetical protein
MLLVEILVALGILAVTGFASRMAYRMGVRRGRSLALKETAISKE